MQSLVLFLTRLIARIPLAAALRLGRGLGWVYGAVIRYHRRDALEALARSLPDTTEQERLSICDRMYTNLGVNLIEMIRVVGGDPDIKKRVMIEGEAIVQEALKRKKGAIMLTAHFGNWDLLAMFTAARGYPLTIISKNIKNRTVNKLWMTVRKRFGVNIILSHNSARAALTVLRRNELLGFILDQNRPGDQGIFVDFFGRPASTSPGLAMFAAQAQAPVIPVFIHRAPDGIHHLQVLPLLEPPGDREPETVRLATQEYTRIIEAQVRQHPEQWIWLHRRWRNQPKDASPAPGHTAVETAAAP